MKTANRFEVISNLATEVKSSWSNKDVVCFHYFNPNGLIAAKKITDEKINALVDAGKAKSGAIIAYGSLNDFYYAELRALFNKKAVNRIDLIATLKGLRRDIETAEKFIAEHTN
jgi:hypothetical protein